MKKFFIYSSIIVIAGTIMACRNENPSSEVNVDSSFAATVLYFPYTLEEKYIFKNEELGETWEWTSPYDDKKDGIWPDSYIYRPKNISENGVAHDSNGRWTINTFVRWYNSTTQEISFFMTYSPYNPYAECVHMNAYVKIESEHKIIKAYGDVLCSPEEAFSYFTDTITLPIEYYYDRIEKVQLTPTDGVYVRVVKGKGLTDFSLDGETVWRRVYE